MFRKLISQREARMRNRRLRDVPQYLSPHMMRDIGLEPWPEKHPIRILLPLLSFV